MAFESHPIVWNLEQIRVTASFGVGVVNPTDQDPLTAIARADAALYRAKERGRNDVQVEESADRGRLAQRLFRCCARRRTQRERHCAIDDHASVHPGEPV